MSSAFDTGSVPTLVLVYRANRTLQTNIVREANRRGSPEIKPTFNAVFANLTADGVRASDLAAKAGITRQSMGEVIREMVDLGILQMRPDPRDRRAKLVTFTEKGLAKAQEGREYIFEMEERLVDEVGEQAYEQARYVLSRLVSIFGEHGDS